MAADSVSLHMFIDSITRTMVERQGEEDYQSLVAQVVLPKMIVNLSKTQDKYLEHQFIDWRTLPVGHPDTKGTRAMTYLCRMICQRVERINTEQKTIDAKEQGNDKWRAQMIELKNITGTGSKVIIPKGKLFSLAFFFASFITF